MLTKVSQDFVVVIDGGFGLFVAVLDTVIVGGIDMKGLLSFFVGVGGLDIMLWFG